MKIRIVFNTKARRNEMRTTRLDLRLRKLIAAREITAEEFQRICEKDRMHFMRTIR